MTANDVNYSAIASDESVVFTDGFGTSWTNTASDVEFEISTDPGILNRAEWIHFVAAFFNLEAKAQGIFSKMKADYNALKGLSHQLGQDTTTEWKGEKPK